MADADPIVIRQITQGPLEISNIIYSTEQTVDRADGPNCGRRSDRAKGWNELNNFKCLQELKFINFKNRILKIKKFKDVIIKFSSVY